MRRAWLPALALFAWPAVLVAPTGPSMSDSVLLAAMRLVDRGTWTLSDERDPKVVFLTEAFDVSVHDGRVYSGVGPGATLVAAPVYGLLAPVLRLFPEEVVANRRLLGYYAANSRGLGRPVPPHLKATYLLQIALVWLVMAPLFAAFVLRLRRGLLAFGTPPVPAATIALAAGLGSLTVYYAAMYSRQGLAYLLAWHALVTLVRPGAVPPRACAAAGLLFGGAIAVDYASGLLVAVALPFLLSRLDVRGRVWLLAPLAAGLALLALYHRTAFGSFLTTPYHHRYWFTPEVLAREGLDLAGFQEGAALGMGAPSPRVMAALCFGAFKGLFVYCPVLLLGLAGHLAGVVRHGRRAFHLAALLAFLAYLVFNSTLGTHVPRFGRHFWGGLSVLWGPRYLLAVVPVLACGLVALDWARRHVRWTAAALLAVSAAVNLAGTMYSDVVLSTYAFGPELEFPLAHVARLVAGAGPRVPLLDVYGVPAAVQAAVLAALLAATAVVLRPWFRPREG